MRAFLLFLRKLRALDCVAVFMVSIYFLSNFLKRVQKFIFIVVFSFFLDFKHMFKGARFAKLIVFAFLAFAKIRAVDSLLETLTVFLLAIRFLAVTALEMSFFFITYS